MSKQTLMEKAEKALREIDVQVDGLIQYAPDPDKCHGILPATRIQSSWEGYYQALYEQLSPAQQKRLEAIQHAPERQQKISKARRLADNATCRRS